MLKSLFHWKVWVNLLVAIGVFVGLVWLTFRWLEYHTDHLKEIPVPNVMNMSVQEAIKTLDDAGLEYDVDSLQYNPKFRPFQVLKMYPAPGAKVKKTRAITIIINPKTWAPVQVPDVIDRYKGLAFRQLEQVGLKVGDTLYEPNIQRDALIRMEMGGREVKPGALIPRFSVVDVVIGTGPKRDMPVPNFVGLTVQEAEILIKENLFEVGVIDYEDGKMDKTDIIYYQDPEVGSLRDQGVQIDLWASKKTPGQLAGKIAELNSIYRMKIDTTLPPLRYEEITPYVDEREPAMPVPPSTTPKAEPKKEPEKKVVEAKPKAVEPAKTSEKPKVVEKPKVQTQKPKVTEPKSTEKPKPSTEKKENKPATPKPVVEEKPKVKQVIVE